MAHRVSPQLLYAWQEGIRDLEALETIIERLVRQLADRRTKRKLASPAGDTAAGEARFDAGKTSTTDVDASPWEAVKRSDGCVEWE